MDAVPGDLAEAFEQGGEGVLQRFGGVLLTVMPILLLVPVNNRNKTWTPDNRPADWKHRLNRWERLHYVRVTVVITAFTLLAIALT